MRSTRLSFLALAALGLLVAIVPAAASAATHIKSLSSFGKYGSGAGELINPGGSAYAHGGDYYVADEGNNRVDVFGPDGAFKFAFGGGVNKEDDTDLCKAGEACKAGIEGPKAGELSGPEYLALWSDRVFVTEANGNRVSVFSEAGKFLYAFGDGVGQNGSERCDATTRCKAGIPSGKEGAMNEPTGIAADEGLGVLDVADTKNNRIDQFSADGDPQGAFGKEVGQEKAGGEPLDGPPTDQCASFFRACQPGKGGSGAGVLDRPGAIAYSHFEVIYIASPVNNRIEVYDGNQYLYSFGLQVAPDGGNTCDMNTGCVKGSGSDEAGALPSPSAIVVKPPPWPNGWPEVYVADSQANRVDKFLYKTTYIRSWGAGVQDGSSALQICSTSCRAGRAGTEPGAITAPSGIAMDPKGHIVVTETTGKLGSGFARIETFQETEPPSS